MAHRISKETLAKVEDKVKAALEAALAEEGLTLTKTGGKYGEYGSLTFTFAAVEEGPNGVNMASPEAQDFIVNGYLFGASPDDLGSIVNYLGVKYVVEGLRPRARKNPILVRGLEDGKKYGLPEMALKFIVR